MSTGEPVDIFFVACTTIGADSISARKTHPTVGGGAFDAPQTHPPIVGADSISARKRGHMEYPPTSAYSYKSCHPERSRRIYALTTLPRSFDSLRSLRMTIFHLILFYRRLGIILTFLFCGTSGVPPPANRNIRKKATLPPKACFLSTNSGKMKMRFKIVG